MTPLLLLLACTPDVVVTVAADPALPSVAIVSWTSADPVRGSVRLERDGEVIATAPSDQALRTEHSVRVVGLRHGVEHTLVPLELAEDGGETAGEPVTWRAPQAPADLPLFQVPLTSQELAPGYVALHTLDRDRDAVVIVDRDGEVVWYQFVEEGLAVLSVALGRDGRSLWYATHATDYVTTGATIHHVALDGSSHETWSQDLTHSGVVELPEGGFGSLRKGYADHDDGVLIWDEIWETTPDTEERLVFSFEQAFEPERFCYHYDLLIPTDSGEQLYYDWTHANSLVLSEDEAAWILLVRHYDAVLRIDRATGAVAWVFGGPHSDLVVEPGEPPFDHGHMSWTDGGELLIFDNGNHREPPASRVVGYQLDEEAGSASRSFSWSPDDEAFSEWLGDAVATPQGTVLSSWTTEGQVFEVSRDGELLWELDSEAFTGTGRVLWLPDLHAQGR